MLKLFKKKSEAEVRRLFLQAAIQGDFKILKKWIKKVKKIQWAKVLEEALHVTVRHNNNKVEVIEYLIENGAKLDVKDQNGHTALSTGPKEWILSRGGPNTMNGAGQTEIPEFTL